MTTAQITWLALLVMFAILEGATAAIVSVWFCAGALAALLLATLFPGAIALQVIAFLLVSGLCIFALRPVFQKMVGPKRVATNADANIGKVCQVTTEIQPGRFGRVKLEGLEWTAKSTATLPVGSWCRVDAIEGVKLVVSPTPGTPPPQNSYELQ